MDEFLSAIGVQAIKFAMRSGIALTSNYALGQLSRLLQSVEDERQFSELNSLQKLLDTKIKVNPCPIELLGGWASAHLRAR